MESAIADKKYFKQKVRLMSGLFVILKNKIFSRLINKKIKNIIFVIDYENNPDNTKSI